MSEPESRRVSIPALVALAALGILIVWTRFLPIGTSFWNDEAYTALNYVEGGPRSIFFAPYVPNNHVLFSLLAWATTSLFGRSEAVYRIWSVVPAIAAGFVVAIWLAYRFGGWCAVAFGVLLATSPVHLELAPQARGYGIGFLASALTLVGAAEAIDGRHPLRGFASFAGGGFLGIATLPVFVLPFLGQAAALAARAGTRKGALACAGLVGALALSFLAPMLREIATTSGQDFGDLVPWSAVFTGPYRDLFQPSFEMLSPEGPRWLAATAFAGLLGLGSAALWRRDEYSILAILAAPIAATYLGLVALGLRSVPRFVSYLLIDVAVLAAFGAIEVVRAAGRVRAANVAAAALGALALAAVVRVCGLAEEAAAIPFESYRPAIASATAAGIPQVMTNSHFGAGFKYYARPRSVRFATPDVLERLFCETTEPLVFVYSPLFTNPVDVACLEARGAVATVFPQRNGGKAGWITVYVLRPSEGSSFGGAAPSGRA